MKIVALFLSLCLSLNVLAASELEQAFDDYHYALTVEWDQKDTAFKEGQTNLFFSNIEKLIAKGLSHKEIMNFVESKVSDQKILVNLETKLNSLATTAATPAELSSLLNDHSEDFYQQGASWEYSKGAVATIVVAVSALFVFGIFFNIKYGCVQTIDGVKSYCTDDPSYNHF